MQQVWQTAQKVKMEPPEDGATDLGATTAEADAAWERFDERRRQARLQRIAELEARVREFLHL